MGGQVTAFYTSKYPKDLGMIFCLFKVRLLKGEVRKIFFISLKAEIHDQFKMIIFK